MQIGVVVGERQIIKGRSILPKNIHGKFTQRKCPAQSKINENICEAK